ncbi:peptide chain release factor 1 [Tychonema sp. BBK16]|uniref:peptide chain release factor 1 n=1 Tax=Tychonema sp. BBK16 TaxID=2699888 RepID=UPI001F2CAB73|nr:peptide chain release factor 1 [Tychonema sp. BBK16]MCF6374743.1 peptide chain release factor 1 [Tychonema sp. BBK16]
MSDFLRRLKILPWQEMLQIAALVNLTVLGIELFLAWSTKIPAISNALRLLYSSLGILVPVGIAVGMGALAVYFLEYWQQQFLLNQTNLWLLVFCLFLGLFLKSLLLPPLFISLSQATLIGIVVGVFWKGRPYWR